MDKKVLIIHSLFSSKEAYQRLCRDLKDYGCKADLFTMYGLDNEDDVYPFNTLIEYYSSHVIHAVEKEHYDYIIAHGTGAVIALSAIAHGLRDIPIMLVAPVTGIPFRKRLMLPHMFIPWLFRLILKTSGRARIFLIKAVSRPVIGRFEYYRQIERFIEKSSGRMVNRMLSEVAKFKVPYTHTYRSICLVECTNDKIMKDSQTLKLVERLGDSLVRYSILESGHSPMLTNYEEFFNKVKILLDLH